MFPATSMLSLAASGLYGFVMLACMVAAVTARQRRQGAGHVWTWAVLCVLFGILMAVRLGGVEEWLRATLREALRADGGYGDRRKFQAPIAGAILVISSMGIFAFVYRATRNLAGRRNIARLVAVLAALAMLFLIALRMASLHAIDALLYGAIKLNWVIDIGASVIIILAALHYSRLVRSKP